MLGLRDEIAALEAEIGEGGDIQVRCGSVLIHETTSNSLFLPRFDVGFRLTYD